MVGICEEHLLRSSSCHFLRPTTGLLRLVLGWKRTNGVCHRVKWCESLYQHLQKPQTPDPWKTNDIHWAMRQKDFPRDPTKRYNPNRINDIMQSSLTLTLPVITCSCGRFSRLCATCCVSECATAIAWCMTSGMIFGVWSLQCYLGPPVVYNITWKRTPDNSWKVVKSPRCEGLWKVARTDFSTSAFMPQISPWPLSPPSSSGWLSFLKLGFHCGLPGKIPEKYVQLARISSHAVTLFQSATEASGMMPLKTPVPVSQAASPPVTPCSVPLQGHIPCAATQITHGPKIRYNSTAVDAL